MYLLRFLSINLYNLFIYLPPPPLILWRPACIANPLFQILSPPLPPTSQLPPTPTATFHVLLNDNMDLHMSIIGALVPEGPWCVFYATRHQVYWGPIHNTVFYWYSDLISHIQTHTNTQHTQGLVDWHTLVNIYLYHVIHAHSSYFY